MLIKDHVLLSRATELTEVDAEFRQILTPGIISSIVSLIPDEWLKIEWQDQSPDEIRDVYAKFLNLRIAASAIFVAEAQHAREPAI